MVELRRAVPEDAALLAATRQKVWASTYRGIYPDEMIDGFDYAWHTARETANLQNPVYHTFLVMDGDECCGYVTYLVKDTPIWRDYHVLLLSLYLLPRLQGKGLGRYVFDEVKKACREHGYSRLYLMCQPDNVSAMGFYEHLGGWVVAQDICRENPEENTVYFEFICK